MVTLGQGGRSCGRQQRWDDEMFIVDILMIGWIRRKEEEQSHANGTGG